MQFLKHLVIWALTWESRLIIRKYKPFIIAVTGSVGKTATKDAIFCVLSGNGHVRKSEKSLNSEIGLPLTIIGVPNAWKSFSGWIENLKVGAGLILRRKSYPQTLVLEIGADHPGDIKKVVKWLKPDIAVITRVGDTPVHVEFFNSPLQVFEEKSALVRALKPGGTAILFADEPKIVALGDEMKEKGASVITFGTTSAALVRGSDFAATYDRKGDVASIVGFSININLSPILNGAENEVATPESRLITVKGVIGISFIYPLLVAVAVGRVRGISLDESIKKVTTYHAPKGRMNIIQGIMGSTLIDDTYNSSPDAVIAALETMKGIHCTGKKIIILGDMMELGTYSAEAHHLVGKQVLGIADILVTIGPRARTIAEEALANGMTQASVASFSNAQESIEAVKSLIGASDVVLIKGSQSVRMERITKALMADPERAEELLVRQEKEWLEKK